VAGSNVNCPSEDEARRDEAVKRRSRQKKKKKKKKKHGCKQKDWTEKTGRKRLDGLRV
jgi:hypothetical protein